MAVNLTTGVPGAGKTLFTIKAVLDALKKKENAGRPVYYWRIPDLTLDWTPIAEDGDIEGARQAIHDLPTGAIMVLDECHKLFPQRGPGKPVPPYIEKFDEHRHRGHDFYLITQVASQFDHFVKYRVTQHTHLKRRFGMNRAYAYEWSEFTDTGDHRAYQTAVKRHFRYPKKLFEVYKSADMHTNTAQVPWLKLAGVGGVIAVTGGIAYHLFTGFLAGKPKDDSRVTSSSVQISGDRRSIEQFEAARSLDWAAMWVEVVKGNPHSIPFFEPFLEPATIPKIDGCMRVQTATIDRCSCNTQQGTRITSISYDECVWYLENGWFDPFKPDDEEGDIDNEHQPQLAQGEGDEKKGNPFGL